MLKERWGTHSASPGRVTTTTSASSSSRSPSSPWTRRSRRPSCRRSAHRRQPCVPPSSTASGRPA